MKSPLKPAHLPEHLYRLCSYFLPRLMFLRSVHGAQISWGDITIALQDFPAGLQDLSSAEFWEEWMQRWNQQGYEYSRLAGESGSTAGAKAAWRSAAACFHWAEFMYFSDPVQKTQMRQAVKECFMKSLEHTKLPLSTGEFMYGDVRVPYYLVLPDVSSDSKKRWPCVILSNGLDSVTEVEVFAFAEQFLARGIAVFMFDGPGQGINLGCNSIDMQFENVVQKIIARLRFESAVDSSRLGFFGISFGGYLALRVARYLGTEFRAVVNLSGGPSLSPYATLPRRLKEDFRYAFMGGDDADMQRLFDQLRLTEPEQNTVDTLSVHGALDDIFPLKELQHFHQYLGINHPLKIYPTEAHVCLNYISQYSIEVSDWLETKLVKSAD
ncbi:alpha/beta hydrolase [Mixta theicola]|uniref:Alpha/beta hydrolase n=1 Tax=Mixta theicola TaxID=1458355 RepID=A0A2K1Q7S5_9GAMM|nr:alpha/beta hydrolase [Mixta theicola]PNS11093.1 alpha/beta hydrolase [Mixta theicola]